MSAIWSASSSATKRTSSSTQVPCRTWSESRPGVAISRSMPRSSCSAWRPNDIPPTTVRHHRPSDFASGISASVTCTASSRVGTRTRPRGSSGAHRALVQAGEQRQAEGERLARPGLRAPEHVPAGERIGQRGRLDGEGIGDAGLGERVQQGSGQPELGERGDLAGRAVLADLAVPRRGALGNGGGGAALGGRAGALPRARTAAVAVVAPRLGAGAVVRAAGAGAGAVVAPRAGASRVAARSLRVPVRVPASSLRHVPVRRPRFAPRSSDQVLPRSRAVRPLPERSSRSLCHGARPRVSGRLPVRGPRGSSRSCHAGRSRRSSARGSRRCSPWRAFVRRSPAQVSWRVELAAWSVVRAFWWRGWLARALRRAVLFGTGSSPNGARLGRPLLAAGELSRADEPGAVGGAVVLIRASEDRVRHGPLAMPGPGYPMGSPGPAARRDFYRGC